MRRSHTPAQPIKSFHMRAQGGRMYNVLFPIWMLVWFPSWLWLLLIPANYLIDRLVLAWSLRDRMDTDHRRSFVRQHTWKVCLAGFAADFAGALLLLLAVMLPSWVQNEFIERIGWAVGMNPFVSLPALLVYMVALAVAGVCIYVLDLRILRAAGLEASAARQSALMLAVVTTPYLFLLPTSLLYRGL